MLRQIIEICFGKISIIVRTSLTKLDNSRLSSFFYEITVENGYLKLEILRLKSAILSILFAQPTEAPYIQKVFTDQLSGYFHLLTLFATRKFSMTAQASSRTVTEAPSVCRALTWQ